MKNFINTLKNNPNNAYDYIVNNYYTMSKDELKNIIKELLYSIYSNCTPYEHDNILQNVGEELADFYEEYEE